MSKWEEVGVIGVDAGLCWIGDPCYCVTPDATEHPAETWKEFCDILRDTEIDRTKQWYYQMGHAGLGVSVNTGGDGCFPVYVKRDEDGRITEVKVKFI
jgi:hypothetical protein